MKFTFKNAKNLRWASDKKESISADILFEEIGEYIPFHATPEDPEEHGRQAFDILSSGKFGPIGDPVDNSEVIHNLKKASLSAEAEKKITFLNRVVKLNMATEEEKQELEQWELYSVLLSRTKVGEEFPAKP